MNFRRVRPPLYVSRPVEEIEPVTWRLPDRVYAGGLNAHYDQPWAEISLPRVRLLEKPEGP